MCYEFSQWSLKAPFVSYQFLQLKHHRPFCHIGAMWHVLADTNQDGGNAQNGGLLGVPHSCHHHISMA